MLLCTAQGTEGKCELRPSGSGQLGEPDQTARSRSRLGLVRNHLDRLLSDDSRFMPGAEMVRIFPPQLRTEHRPSAAADTLDRRAFEAAGTI